MKLRMKKFSTCLIAVVLGSRNRANLRLPSFSISSMTSFAFLAFSVVICEIASNKSSFNGNYLIILNSFEDQNVANAESQKYISDGYDNCDVFYLGAVSNYSNLKKDIFQTYIGPFNKLEEANQFLNSTKEVSEIGKIIELQ